MISLIQPSTENTKRPSRALVSTEQRRRSPLLPLAAFRRSSISASSAHYLAAAAASPGPQSRIFANPSDWLAGRRRGRQAPIGRFHWPLVGLLRQFTVHGSRCSSTASRTAPGHPRYQTPARSPPRASCGTPPASSRGLLTAGRPWTRP
jgi:hypothetical protein